MNSADNIADFNRMYKELTDPEIREKKKRETELKKRREDKMKDTGLTV